MRLSLYTLPSSTYVIITINNRWIQTRNDLQNASEPCVGSVQPYICIPASSRCGARRQGFCVSFLPLLFGGQISRFTDLFHGLGCEVACSCVADRSRLRKSEKMRFFPFFSDHFECLFVIQGCNSLGIGIQFVKSYTLVSSIYRSIREKPESCDFCPFRLIVWSVFSSFWGVALGFVTCLVQNWGFLFFWMCWVGYADIVFRIFQYGYIIGCDFFAKRDF